MGGKESKPTISDQQNPTINHPRFINYNFVKNSHDQDCIQISVPLASDRELKNWEKLLQNAPNNTEPIFLPLQHFFKKEGYCGSSGYVQIKYPNFPFLLADQINNREHLQHKLFDQNQLWYLIYTLLGAADSIHSQGRKIGDIRPDNIFINQQGQVKVATVYSWPCQQSNYQKTFFEKQITYLAPQQIKAIQFGKIQPGIDYQLAETFSIGLTILDAATLSDSKLLYNKNLKFDYQKFQETLGLFKLNNYSQILGILIQNMCQVQANNRQKAIDLFKWLKPYQDYIINLQNFQISGIPEKLLITHQNTKNNSSRVGTVINSQQYSHVNNSPPPIPHSQITKQKIIVQHRLPEIQHSLPIQRYTNNPYGSQIPYIPPHPVYSQVYPHGVLAHQPVNRIPQAHVVESPKIVQTSQVYMQYHNPISHEYNKQQQQNRPSIDVNTKKAYSLVDKIDEQLQLSRKMFPS